MKTNIINKNLNTNNVITCDNLTITFGKKHPQMLIQDFNYAFAKAKVYAIIGKSGEGKTTLVSHFNGLLKSKAGNIFIKDKVILAQQRKIRNYKEIRKDVGLVFQFPEYQLFKDTVQKDIAFGPINYHVDKAQAYKIASKYSNLVGLDLALLSSNPFELSNGQKRLVALAGVLAIESDVVILDEPTAGLDPYYQDKIVNIIKQLKEQGKTVIIITHNTNNVLSLADEVLLLYNRRLYCSGTPYEIFTNKSLLEETKIRVPHIIATINKLISFDSKYKYLLTAQPKSLDELVELIKKGGY